VTAQNACTLVAKELRISPFLFFQPWLPFLIPVIQVIFLLFAWGIAEYRTDTNTRSENYRFVCKWSEDVTYAVNRNRIKFLFVAHSKYTAWTSYEFKFSLNMQAMKLSSVETVTIMRYLS
jgi:hypothetical protein